MGERKEGKRRVPVNTKLRKLFGANLGDTMKALGVATKLLAQEAGMPESTINRIKRGANATTLDTIGQLADKLRLRDYRVLFAPREATLTGDGEDPSGRDGQNVQGIARRTAKRKDKK